MKNLPVYEDYRLFESAGPLASSFKRVGFKEMTRTDFEGFGGVQEGGLIYDGGENFIVLYGLATDDSKPVVCVMYGNDPYDQVEAHILNQAEQKAFISKLSSFTKEMDRLCALPAGTEKTDGIKAWLRKFGFQVISGPVMNEGKEFDFRKIGGHDAPWWGTDERGSKEYLRTLKGSENSIKLKDFMEMLDRIPQDHPAHQSNPTKNLRKWASEVLSESWTDMPDDLRLSAVLDDLTIVMKALESKDYKSSGMKRFVDKMQNKLSDVYNEIERFEDK